MTSQPAAAADADQTAEKAVAVAAAGTEVAAATDATTLPGVTVTAKRPDRYVVENISSSTKTDTPLRDVPQSITVVTREQIKDQGMQGIADVVRYVPGINISQGEGNRDQVVIRGNNSTADFFIDGMRDDVQYFRDLYNIERVEALKGPNAMIFGRGGSGGLINRVSKEAEWAPTRELTLQGGSYGNKRAAVDIGQGLSSAAALRFNGMYENSGSYRDYVHLERFGLNPTAAFAIDERTKVKLGYEYFKDHRVADRGIPSFQGRPSHADVSTFFGNPDQSYADVKAHAVDASVEHVTASGLTIRNHTRYADYDKVYQNVFPGAVNTTGDMVSISAYGNATKRSNLLNQSDLIYMLQTGAVSHKLLGGAEFGRQTTDNFRQTGYFNNATTTIQVPFNDPVTYTPVTFRQSASDADGRSVVNLAAVYVQDQIVFSPQFQAIAGLRFDNFNLKYRNNRNGTELSRTDNLVSPRLGLVYKPLDPLSLYASYSVSYLPSSGDQFGSIDATTQTVKPEKFVNYEIGSKWDIRPNLALTAAVFQLDRTNTKANDPNNPGQLVLTGSQRSKGVELGLAGSITESWQVMGGYAYQSAYITSQTTTANAGARVALVPKHTASLWSKYQVVPMWGAGLGVIHQSSIYAGIDNTVTLPSFTRLDGAVFFTLNPKLSAQLNLENLVDRKYYVNANSNNNITPGSPRAARLTVTMNY
ncbi:MAG: TonB-dependent siderophore receptor [Nevskiaceae bacterium]|nr:MAG: TonB-dependent siderophore receptor [Nevskiaceae bacterium]